jgi:polyisoprenoid-binding protein YceI
MTVRINFLHAVILFVAGSAFAQQSKDVWSLDASVTYLLQHPLHHIEATSKEPHFKITVDPVQHTMSSVMGTVDVMTFSSGNSNRDSHAGEVIDAISYPDASFQSSNVTWTGSLFKVDGKITFHGVTKDITIMANAKWVGANRLEVEGKFDCTLTQFNIERPALLLVPVEDKLSFEFSAAFQW